MYPDQDPNIDLNFDNDILYGAILNDAIDKYNTKYVTTPDIPPSINTKKHKITRTKLTESPNNRLYIVFIIIVILLVFLWYMYGGKETEKKPPYVIDTYADHPKLTMLSPDIGMGARYGNI
jgi:hypothetical protein